MNKLTQFSVATILALCLAACDNAETTTTTNNVATAAKTETVSLSPADEFKKLVEWGQKQQQVLFQIQSDLQQSLASKDQTKIMEAGKSFEKIFADLEQQLFEMDIKDEAIAKLKLKMRSSLGLSNSAITDAIQMMTNPEKANELMPQVQTKKVTLMQLNTDIQQQITELKAKFGIAE